MLTGSRCHAETALRDRPKQRQPFQLWAGLHHTPACAALCSATAPLHSFCDRAATADVLVPQQGPSRRAAHPGAQARPARPPRRSASAPASTSPCAKSLPRRLGSPSTAWGMVTGRLPSPPRPASCWTRLLQAATLPTSSAARRMGSWPTGPLCRCPALCSLLERWRCCVPEQRG